MIVHWLVSDVPATCDVQPEKVVLGYIKLPPASPPRASHVMVPAGRSHGPDEPSEYPHVALAVAV